MGEMLQQGERFPQLELKLLPESDQRYAALSLPDGAPSRYTALLFYRGHW